MECHGTDGGVESQTDRAIICDMWDKHWCPDATERVAEMAPVMNRVIAKARENGVLIVHCPSDTMNYYKDYPGGSSRSLLLKLKQKFL